MIDEKYVDQAAQEFARELGSIAIREIRAAFGRAYQADMCEEAARICDAHATLHEGSKQEALQNAARFIRALPSA